MGVLGEYKLVAAANPTVLMQSFLAIKSNFAFFRNQKAAQLLISVDFPEPLIPMIPIFEILGPQCNIFQNRLFSIIKDNE